MDKDNDGMEEAYTTRMQEVRDLLTEFQARLDLHESKENRNWGHVGDLGHFRQGLRELLGLDG